MHVLLPSALLLSLATLVSPTLAHPDAAFYHSYDLAHPTAAPSAPHLALRHDQAHHPKPRLARRSGCSKKKHVKATSSSATPTSAASSLDEDWSTARPHRTQTRSFGHSSSSSASVPLATPSSGGSSTLAGYHDPTCGGSGATDETSESGGPNGSEEWLNCGLSKNSPDAGWTPPSIEISQLKTLTIEEALAMDDSVYSHCKDYVSLFEKYGDKHGLPPILLAAFAMQESSCKADTLGDAGGAFGLMQITEGELHVLYSLMRLVDSSSRRADKCGDSPDGNCSDAEYNIKTAAAYFAKTLEEQGGNLLLALGTYNGWYDGLTYSKATEAAWGDCCECQNNLDYHQQMLNGWLLGIDGSQLGTSRNLEVCSS
ncbi:hypothetical protein JCM6882_005051 [Rhodosporidiobolus microsporus]